jgi:hypothetical protein
MIEAKLSRVQELTSKSLHRAFDRCVADRVIATAAVIHVTDDWMTDVREMNANLMCAAGFYLYSKEREIFIALGYLVNRMSRPACSSLEHSHPRSVVCSASDSSFNLATLIGQAPIDKRYIQLEDLSLAKLI